MHTATHCKLRRVSLVMIMAAAVNGCDTGVYMPADTPPEALRMEAAIHRETAAARWVALTRTIIARREFGPLGTARTYALVSVAQYNAVIAATDGKDRGLHPSEAGAASAAAATVLRALYPMEAATIDAQLAADAAFLPLLPSERSCRLRGRHHRGRAGRGRRSGPRCDRRERRGMDGYNPRGSRVLVERTAAASACRPALGRGTSMGARER
jgi:hypothetical protein